MESPFVTLAFILEWVALIIESDCGKNHEFFIILSRETARSNGSTKFQQPAGPRGPITSHYFATYDNLNAFDHHLLDWALCRYGGFTLKFQ